MAACFLTAVLTSVLGLFLKKDFPKQSGHFTDEHQNPAAPSTCG